MGKIFLKKYGKNPLVNGWGKMACEFRTTGQFWSNPQKPEEPKRQQACNTRPGEVP